MVTTYTTAAKVQGALQFSEAFSVTTSPTLAQVNSLINRKEDRIDQMLKHGWRVKTSNELLLSPSFLDYQNGLRFDLPNYSVKELDSLEGDVLEVFDGREYIDYLGTKTNGRTNDYWLDLQKGVLYIRGGVNPRVRQSIKIKYRYGDSAVTGDIEDLATYMVCIDILNMWQKNITLTDDGGSKTSSQDQRITYFKEQVKEILNSKSSISTF